MIFISFGAVTRLSDHFGLPMENNIETEHEAGSRISARMARLSGLTATFWHRRRDLKRCLNLPRSGERLLVILPQGPGHRAAVSRASGSPGPHDVDR